MKQLIFLLVLCLFATLHLKAQACIDTVHLKGYYIVKKHANEVQSNMKRKGNKTIVEQPVDVHYDESFVLCDSISKQKPLSYWLNHFFDDTKQVFISGKKLSVKYVAPKECLADSKNKIDSCNFPELKSNRLYQTINLNTGDVFAIYYLDAYWGRVRIKKDSPEADIIPGKIAQRSISSDVSEFDLYTFIKAKKVNGNPRINDSYIRVWRD